MVAPTYSRVSPSLSGRQYINLITYRKNGTPVQTTVFFIEYNGVIYIETSQWAGKVKRIRHNAQVQIAPCTVSGKPLGAPFAARARFVTDIQEIHRAKSAMQMKYGLRRQFYHFLEEAQTFMQRKQGGQLIYIALMPVRIA